jgi:hypothetical protein
MENLLLKVRVPQKEKKVVLLKVKKDPLLDQMESHYHLEKVVLP